MLLVGVSGTTIILYCTQHTEKTTGAANKARMHSKINLLHGRQGKFPQGNDYLLFISPSKEGLCVINVLIPALPNHNGSAPRFCPTVYIFI